MTTHSGGQEKQNEAEKAMTGIRKLLSATIVQTVHFVF